MNLTPAQQLLPLAPGLPTLLRATEAANAVNLSRSTFYAEVAAGRLPAPIHLSARRRAWSAESLNAWLTSRADAAKEVA